MQSAGKCSKFFSKWVFLMEILMAQGLLNFLKP